MTNVVRILFLLDSACPNSLSKFWNNIQREAGPPDSPWRALVGKRSLTLPDPLSLSKHAGDSSLHFPRPQPLATPSRRVYLLFWKVDVCTAHLHLVGTWGCDLCNTFSHCYSVGGTVPVVTSINT